MGDATDAYREVLDEALTATQTAERIRAALGAQQHVVKCLDAITAVDSGVAPELGACVEHLSHSADALERALVFVNARFDAALERIGNQLGEAHPPEEGDTV